MLSAYEKGALNNSRHFHLAWLSKIFILIKNACKFYHRLSTSVKLIIQLSPFSLLMSWFALIDFLMLNQLCIMEIGPPRSGALLRHTYYVAFKLLIFYWSVVCLNSYLRLTQSLPLATALSSFWIGIMWPAWNELGSMWFDLCPETIGIT